MGEHDRKRIAIPADYVVQPLRDEERATARATCGTCGLSWDDGIATSMTPVPSARCPFEAFHDEPSDPDSDDCDRCFIAHADGTYSCEDCWTPEQRASTADDDVEVWREYSDGWTGPIVCAGCALSIPVYVNGGKGSSDAH